MTTLPRQYEHFRSAYPSVWQAYENLGAAAAQAGPLDTKFRELIKLGMAAAGGNESSVHSHTHRALEAGASSLEIEHTILIGINTIGFPRMMTALSWVQAAIEAHQDSG